MTAGRFPVVNDEQKQAVGKVLLELRENTGMERQEFADICNVDVSQLLKIERGDGEPGFMTILKIATGLKMKPGKLVDIIYDRLEEKRLLDPFQF